VEEVADLIKAALSFIVHQPFIGGLVLQAAVRFLSEWPYEHLREGEMIVHGVASHVICSGRQLFDQGRAISTHYGSST
tara:strand:+ start:306 stop:539 length:234 start_codon:yes stop_codon:yes gene_type:complete